MTRQSQISLCVETRSPNFPARSPRADYVRSGTSDKKSATIAVGKTSDNVVRYFDLVDKSVDSMKCAEPKKSGKNISAAYNRNGDSRFVQSQNFATVGDESRELIDVLLFQLDQIVCLDEIAENLDRLDAAVVVADNFRSITSIADALTQISLVAEFNESYESLRRLGNLTDNCQSIDIKSLAKRIRAEFEIFKTNVKTNLDRTAAIAQR